MPTRRRIRAVLRGRRPLASLGPADRADVNRMLDAAITESALSTPLGELLAAEGVTTLALDEVGLLVEYRPDGSRVTLGALEQPEEQRGQAGSSY